MAPCNFPNDRTVRVAPRLMLALGSVSEQLQSAMTKTLRFNWQRPVRLVLAAVTVVLPITAWPLALSEATGRIEIGQPLSMRITLHDSTSSSLRADCVHLLPPAEEPLDSSLASARVSLTDGAILVSGSQPLSAPVLSFSVHVRCGFEYIREYLLLPAPPRAVSTQELGPESAILPVAASPMAASDDGDFFVVNAPTTLRQMSRLRYPTDSRARVKFIRRVAAANRGIFADIATSYDQPLAAGTRLSIPSARATRLPETPRTAVSDDAPHKPSRKEAGGRLHIGAHGVPVRSTAELEADINRLAEFMNEQIKIEISLVERIKQLEADVALAKQQAAEQRRALERLSAHVEAARERESHTSFMQLGLTLLLIGVAGAGLLLLKRRNDRLTDMQPDTRGWTIAPEAPTQPVRIQSVFDDLIPPR